MISTYFTFCLGFIYGIEPLSAIFCLVVPATLPRHCTVCYLHHIWQMYTIDDWLIDWLIEIVSLFLVVCLLLCLIGHRSIGNCRRPLMAYSPSLVILFYLWLFLTWTWMQRCDGRSDRSPSERGVIATFNVDHQSARELRHYLGTVASQSTGSRPTPARPSSTPPAGAECMHTTPPRPAPLVIILDDLHHVASPALLADAFNALLGLPLHDWYLRSQIITNLMRFSSLLCV